MTERLLGREENDRNYESKRNSGVAWSENLKNVKIGFVNKGHKI